MEIVDHPLSVPLFVVGRARVCVGHAESEGSVEQDRELPSGRGHGLGFADAGGEARAVCVRPMFTAAIRNSAAARLADRLAARDPTCLLLEAIEPVPHVTRVE